MIYAGHMRRRIHAGHMDERSPSTTECVANLVTSSTRSILFRTTLSAASICSAKNSVCVSLFLSAAYVFFLYFLFRLTTLSGAAICSAKLSLSLSLSLSACCVVRFAPPKTLFVWVYRTSLLNIPRCSSFSVCSKPRHISLVTYYYRLLRFAPPKTLCSCVCLIKTQNTHRVFV